MKVIFLDIDGVLNLRNRSRDKYGSKFHSRWVRNLRKIIEATDAKIVVTSVWRHSGLEFIKNMWADRKLPGEVVGITGDLRFNRNTSANCPRGSEIEEWLKNHKFQRINWSRTEFRKHMAKSEVSNYVILDDDSDMLYCQYEHFVKCSINHNHKGHIEGYGLTDENAEIAIKILNTNIEELYYGLESGN